MDCKDAWSGLQRRALRSLLSGLGIGIGVIALVSMLSIGEGAKRQALEKIVSLGINTIRIEDASSQIQLENQGIINISPGLTNDDARRILKWLNNRGHIGVYVREDTVTVLSKSRHLTSMILGTSPEWFVAERLQLSWGRPLLSDDLAQQRRVCILGDHLATALQINSPITIQFRGIPCMVVGVLKPRGRLLTEGSGLSALDFDNLVMTPLSAFPFVRMLAGQQLLDGLVITLNDERESRLLEAVTQVREILKLRHRNVADFQIVVPFTLLQEARETQRLFALIMGTIASLSLLVGGIGVMNVMLANISEQTREIALRIAVGATKMRIISLYLWHSILLTLAGSVWGILGGVLFAIAIQEYADWEVAFSGVSLVFGPVSAMITGLIFGLHPALRAASLEPAQALREV